MVLEMGGVETKGNIGSEEGKGPGRLLLCEDDAEKKKMSMLFKAHGF